MKKIIFLSIFLIIFFVVLWNSYRAQSNEDQDGDGIQNQHDRCRDIPGVEKNEGCPLLSDTCNPRSNTNTCIQGYVCSSEGICVAKKISKKIDGCIAPTDRSSIFWNLFECDNEYTLMFTDILRKCDILFPAITSPDGTKIYSRWNVYQIPYEK